jgi:hypothetical protein
MENTNTKRLENNIDQLSEEHQFVLICVLEALTFAQNESEMPVEETEEAYYIPNC